MVMDVHHHAHTPRKKWTHYFWEFLMLFFAVFCGFLAENQREHFIEHKREVQYIKSFIEDLKSDTVAYNSQIRTRTTYQMSADSLILFLLSAERNEHLDSIYVRIEEVGRETLFAYNDRTIQQLKNSGGMRLIRNQAASDSMMNYDQVVRNMQYFELKRDDILDKFREVSSYLVDAAISYSMAETGREVRIKRPNGNSTLFSENPETINRLCYWANRFRIVNRQIMFNQTSLKNKAIRIMEFLRKEYKLK
jgi:hypothetical protein